MKHIITLVAVAFALTLGACCSTDSKCPLKKKESCCDTGKGACCKKK